MTNRRHDFPKKFLRAVIPNECEGSLIGLLITLGTGRDLCFDCEIPQRARNDKTHSKISCLQSRERVVNEPRAAGQGLTM